MTVNYTNAEGFGVADVEDKVEARNQFDHALIIDNLTDREANTPRRIKVEIRTDPEMVDVISDSPTIATPFGDEYGLQTIHTHESESKQVIEATLYGRLSSVPAEIGYPQMTALGTNNGYFNPRLIRDFRQYPHRDGSRYTTEAKRYDPRNARFFDKENFNILKESISWINGYDGEMGSAWHKWSMMYIEFYNENDEPQINPLYKDMETPPAQGWGHWITSDYSRAPANTGASALAQLREIHPDMQYMETVSYNGMRKSLGLPKGWRARLPGMTVTNLMDSNLGDVPLRTLPFNIDNLGQWGDLTITNIDGVNETNMSESVERLAVYPAMNYNVASGADTFAKVTPILSAENPEEVIDFDVAVEDYRYDPDLPFEISVGVLVGLTGNETRQPDDPHWALDEAFWVTQDEGGLEVLKPAYAFREVYHVDTSDQDLLGSIWRAAQHENIRRNAFENRVSLEDVVGLLRFAPYSTGDSISELNCPYNTRPVAGKLRLKFKQIEYREDLTYTYGLEADTFALLKETKPWLPLVDSGTQVVFKSDSTGEVYEPANQEDIQIHLNWLFDWNRALPLTQLILGADLVEGTIAMKDLINGNRWEHLNYEAFFNLSENGFATTSQGPRLRDTLKASQDASGDAIIPINVLSLHKRACIPSSEFYSEFRLLTLPYDIYDSRNQAHRLAVDNFGDWTSEDIHRQPLVVGKLWENLTLNNPNAKLRLSFFFPLDNSSPEVTSSGVAIEFDVTSKSLLASELTARLNGANHTCTYDEELDQLTIGGFNVEMMNFGISVIDSPTHVQHLVLDPEWDIGPILQGEYQGFSNETKTFVKSHKTVFHLWHPTPEAMGDFYEADAVLPVTIGELDQVRNDAMKDELDLLSFADRDVVDVSYAQPVGSNVDFEIIHSAVMPYRTHTVEVGLEGNDNRAFLDRSLAPGMDLIINDPATLGLLLGETTNPEEVLGIFTFNNPTGTETKEVMFKDFTFKEVDNKVVSAHLAFPLINQYCLDSAYVLHYEFQMGRLGLKSFEPLTFTISAVCDTPSTLLPLTEEAQEGFLFGEAWLKSKTIAFVQMQVALPSIYSANSKTQSNPEYILNNETNPTSSEVVGIDWQWSEEGDVQNGYVLTRGGYDRTTPTVTNVWFQGARLSDFGEVVANPCYLLTEFTEGVMVSVLHGVHTLPVVELNFPIFQWTFKTANQVTFTRQLDMSNLPPEIIGASGPLTFNLKAKTREEMATVGTNRQSYFSMNPTRYTDDLYYNEPTMSTGKEFGDDMQVYVIMEHTVPWGANYHFEKLVNRSYRGETIALKGEFQEMPENFYYGTGMNDALVPYGDIATDYTFDPSELLVTTQVPMVTALKFDDVNIFGLPKMGQKVAPYVINFTDEAIVADLKRYQRKGYHNPIGKFTMSHSDLPLTVFNEYVRVAEDGKSAQLIVPMALNTFTEVNVSQDIDCKLELNSGDGVIYTAMEWVNMQTVKVPAMVSVTPDEVNIEILRDNRSVNGAFIVTEMPIGPQTHYENFRYDAISFAANIPLGDTGNKIVIESDKLKMLVIGEKVKKYHFYLFMRDAATDDTIEATLRTAGWNVKRFPDGIVIYGVLAP